MKVYHGSYLKIDKIDLLQCEPRKDFGRGFYVTKLYEQALVWANRKGRNHHTEGIVTAFTFFESAFADKDYKTLRFDAYNDAWLDFVVLNRDFNSPIPAHDYDMVEGPVADDKITSRIDAYVRGEVPRQVFLKELSHEAPTHQICFCTLRSLLMLERTDFSGITAIERAAEKIVEQLMIDRNLSEQEATDIFYNSAAHAQLSSTNLHQKPWREIYKLL